MCISQCILFVFVVVFFFFFFFFLKTSSFLLRGQTMKFLDDNKVATIVAGGCRVVVVGDRKLSPVVCSKIYCKIFPASSIGGRNPK